MLFSIVIAAGATAASLAITLIGIPLLAAAAGVVRGCANAERSRLRLVVTEPVRGRYQAVDRPGIIAQASIRWHDRATWRDLSYLAGLWVPLMALDTVVFSLWAWFLGWISLPAWYWAPWLQYHGRRWHGYQLGFWFPHGPDGPGTDGVFIDTLPTALAAAGLGLIGFAAASYLLVITARANARIARALLRAPADPLTEAKEVLARTGPLGPLTPPRAGTPGRPAG